MQRAAPSANALPWYDPALARFVQADTADPQLGNAQGLNRYSYVENRPLVAVDPTGHFVFFPALTAAVGAAVGFVASLGTQVVAGKGVNWDLVGQATLAGAVIGAGVGAVAPAVVGAVGTLLMGAGLTLDAAGLFGAGMLLTEVADRLSAPLELGNAFDVVQDSSTAQASTLEESIRSEGTLCRGDFPVEGSSTPFQYKETGGGGMTAFAQYDDEGAAVLRTELVGDPDYNSELQRYVPTPHTHGAMWNQHPVTGKWYFNDWSEAVPFDD